jgi:hypothetical protein
MTRSKDTILVAPYKLIAELPNDEAAIALAQQLANTLGKMVEVSDANGNPICVAPIKLNS